MNLSLSEDWSLKGADYIGTTEFYESDGAESDLFILTLEDADGKILTCTYTRPYRIDAGASLDCNFEGYNQPS